MWRALSFLLVCCLLSTGCSARRRAEDTLVRRIRFEGTKNHLFSPHKKGTLKSKMTQRESDVGVLGPFSFAVTPRLFEPGLLEWDERPLEVYLAHEGWFEAELARWEVRQRRRARRAKVAVVDVVGHIVLGPRTVWDATTPEFRWTGPAVLPESALRKLVTMRPGRRFQLDSLVAAERDLARLLLEHGYALGEVEASAEVSDGLAHAVLHLRPGRVYTVGPGQLEGTTTVDPDRVLAMVDLPHGAPWNATLVEHARSELYRLGAFRTVEVGPGEPDATNELPVRLRVVDGRPRKLEFGGSFGFEGAFLVPRASVLWTHDNLRSKLHRLEVGASFGVGASSSQEPIPLFGLHVARHTRRWLETPLDWKVEIRGGNDLFEAVIPRLQVDLGSVWSLRVGRRFSLFGGPRGGLTSLAGAPDANGDRLRQLALGIGTPNPYGWLALEAGAEIADLTQRDQRRHGWTVAVKARHAWVPSGPVQRMEAEAAVLVAPHAGVLGRPLQWKGRIRGRKIFGEDVIWPERLFLGGVSSLRSFRATGVGRYDSICAERKNFRTRQVYLARGGTVSALASTEIELHRIAVRELALTAFAEAGILDSDTRFGGGVGIRYDTPLGPFRMDVAVRPLAPEDGGPAMDLGCERPRRRAFDLLSEFGRYEPLQRTAPAVNLVFSLGLP